MIEDTKITKANIDDAGEVLALQRIAYQSEARLYEDWSIPPLTQSFEDICSEFSEKVFLKGILGNSIIGSVRGSFDRSTCKIGRLIVHPEHQRHGIGTALMVAIETWFAVAERFELFTGERSEGNIRLYTALGYEIFRREALSPKVTLVFMEKMKSSIRFSKTRQ